MYFNCPEKNGLGGLNKEVRLNHLASMDQVKSVPFDYTKIFYMLTCTFCILERVKQLIKSNFNRTTCIRHQCRKTTVLSCHRCLINTGV